MRQDQGFLAHFESKLYDTFESLRNHFSENKSKMWPQITWIRIVPEYKLLNIESFQEKTSENGEIGERFLFEFVTIAFPRTFKLDVSTTYQFLKRSGANFV